MDWTELDAIVSFMLVHHLILALPVVCGRGEGCGYAEAVSSSHNILVNGIRFQMLHAENYSLANLAASRAAKEALLLQLRHDVAAAVAADGATTDGRASNAQVEVCYALFCAAARAYQALYPGSPDMRTRDMPSVCRSDVLHQQALTHVSARASMFAPASGRGVSVACSALSSYPKVIRAAVEQQREGPGI